MLTYADVFRRMPLKVLLERLRAHSREHALLTKKWKKNTGALREAAGAFKRACAAEGGGGRVSSCTDGDGGG